MSQRIPICHACKKRPSVTYRKIDGRYLCKSCFNDSILINVKKTIKKKNLLERNDRIVVGLSGGKDSTSLLHILHKIEREFPSELIAVCIDEGIANYRDDGIPIAEMNAKKFGIEFHLYSFRELFGYTLDEIVNQSRILQKQNMPIKKTKIIHHAPCSFCGVFRRKALNIVARKLSGDKVATGHNLNDVSQTIMLNLFRGDSFKLLRGDLKPEKMHESFVPRVKPLQAVLERDVVLYAYYNEITYHTTECPYAIGAMRLDIRDFLTHFEERYPGSLSCVRNAMDSISQSCGDLLISHPELTADYEEFGEFSASIYLCQKCSEPSSEIICKGCKMLEALFK